MSRASARRGRTPPRALFLCGEGHVYDPDEARWVPLGELVQDVHAGRRFTARQYGSGTDCTYRLLVRVLVAALGPRPTAPPDGGPWCPRHRSAPPGGRGDVPPADGGPAGYGRTR
ncbi:hypothetical protein [Streptomyces luteireticuli]|uniref:Uncharacterized protein n=1 Tax=Streptomyces luteireticuli TaxID=173858 RepID=A0ABN0YZQ0_9ACTN